MFEFKVGDSIDCRDVTNDEVILILKEMNKQGFPAISRAAYEEGLNCSGQECRDLLISGYSNTVLRATPDDTKGAVRYLKASEVLSKLSQSDSKDCPMSKLKTSHEALQTLLKQREELGKKITDAQNKLEEVMKSVNESLPEGFRLVECEGISDVNNPENWRNGDKMEIVDVVDDTHKFDIGSIVTILDVSAMNRSNHAPKVESGDGSQRWVQAENLKFHSRPSC